MHYNSTTYNNCKISISFNINITGGTSKKTKTDAMCNDITELNNK